jgi:D,D-heptose 1,7-bisphosphate phosphatase
MIARQCAILVGGLGTRLGDLTKTTPKPLLPVADAPFLETLLREAARRGFDDIVLLAGHRAELIGDYLAKSGIAGFLGISIRISIEPAALGTAGALVHALPMLADEFLLLNGDTWFDFNWLDLAQRGHDADCELAMSLRQIANPDRYETVVLDGPRVRAFAQRQAGLTAGLINGGVYWMRKSAVAGLAAPSSLECDVLPRLCADGALCAWAYDGFFIDIGVPESYAAAQTSVPAQRKRPAVFFDRDGVLNVDRGYVHAPDDFVWVDGAKAAIKRLNDLGHYVFVVTNQAGIAHGYYGEGELRALHRWIERELREEGAAIDDWRFCPYHPDAKIAEFRRAHEWRKPGPGMILDLLKSWPVDTSRSFLIGDKDSDMQAAAAAGLSGHLFLSGNLLEFVETILSGRISV